MARLLTVLVVLTVSAPAGAGPAEGRKFGQQIMNSFYKSDYRAVVGVPRSVWIEVQMEGDGVCHVTDEGDWAACLFPPGFSMHARFGPRGRVKAHGIVLFDDEACKGAKDYMLARFGEPDDQVGTKGIGWRHPKRHDVFYFYDGEACNHSHGAYDTTKR